jgi:hypothetical protein
MDPMRKRPRKPSQLGSMPLSERSIAGFGPHPLNSELPARSRIFGRLKTLCASAATHSPATSPRRSSGHELLAPQELLPIGCVAS